MKYLINMVHHHSRLEWFQNDWGKVEEFLKKHQINGLELIFYQDYCIDKIPKDLIMGMHLIYYPIWIDFWKENYKSLLLQFNEKKNISMYYGDENKEVLLDKFRSEFEVAQSLNVDYMVFHVSHVEIEHTFTWDFTYSDCEVMDCAVDVINQTFGKTDKGVTLLMENLWWPGLNFKDPELTEEFFNKIHYPNKGFMLDIGHLMITNKDLISMDNACEYIHELLDKNHRLVKYIRGIHLNKSLTGKYLNEDQLEKLKGLNDKKDFWEKLGYAREHISNIDTHIPFDHIGINGIIDRIQPEYIVFEFLPKALNEWDIMIQEQNAVLNRG